MPAAAGQWLKCSSIVSISTPTSSNATLDALCNPVSGIYLVRQYLILHLRQSSLDCRLAELHS